ncbi:hypothetical protein GGR54DRAFT_641387 [Hypoxylon sp. NC1633]|nr:hypothetical protein GGR54DRAFT_641387 [Hypoxylon sp. NC1633]
MVNTDQGGGDDQPEPKPLTDRGRDAYDTTGTKPANPPPKDKGRSGYDTSGVRTNPKPSSGRFFQEYAFLSAMAICVLVTLIMYIPLGN